MDSELVFHRRTQRAKLYYLVTKRTLILKGVSLGLLPQEECDFNECIKLRSEITAPTRVPKVCPNFLLHWPPLEDNYQRPLPSTSI